MTINWITNVWLKCIVNAWKMYCLESTRYNLSAPWSRFLSIFHLLSFHYRFVGYSTRICSFVLSFFRTATVSLGWYRLLSQFLPGLKMRSLASDLRTFDERIEEMWPRKSIAGWLKRQMQKPRTACSYQPYNLQEHSRIRWQQNQLEQGQAWRRSRGPSLMVGLIRRTTRVNSQGQELQLQSQ